MPLLRAMQTGCFLKMDGKSPLQNKIFNWPTAYIIQRQINPKVKKMKQKFRPLANPARLSKNIYNLRKEQELKIYPA